MNRRFILHIGPTNSGKTHDALERLKTGLHGAYFGPLRLLALEVYDRMNTEGVPCSMITGEETLEIPGAVCQACTVEMLNDHEYFDIAVIDECQLVADPHRGHNWTRAILGIRAEEIHLCMAPEAEDIIVQMIRRCGYGLAMGKAMEQVKQVAYAVTDTNEQQGIAKALARYVFHEE